MMFFRDEIPSEEVKISFLPSDVERLVIELNIRKAKWLVDGSYFRLYKMMTIISAILVKYWIV